MRVCLLTSFTQHQNLEKYGERGFSKLFAVFFLLFCTTKRYKNETNTEIHSISLCEYRFNRKYERNWTII